MSEMLDQPSPLDWLLAREPERLTVQHPRYGRGRALSRGEVDRASRQGTLRRADLYATYLSAGLTPQAAERKIEHPTEKST